MAPLKRTSITWLIRTLGALALAAVFAAGVAVPAFAHDNDDDNEIVTYGPNACTTVKDLPVPASATCVKHKTELDDGVTETTNKYVTQAAAAAVQQAFTDTFQRNGWTIIESDSDVNDQEWDYTVVKGLRRVKVEVEAQEPDQGTGTEFTIEEK
jgi:hypothetical protein